MQLFILTDHDFWEEAVNLGFMFKLTWDRSPKIFNYVIMLIYVSIALYLELYLIFVDSDLTWITEKFLWLGFCRCIWNAY